MCEIPQQASVVAKAVSRSLDLAFLARMLASAKEEAAAGLSFLRVSGLNQLSIVQSLNDLAKFLDSLLVLPLLDLPISNLGLFEEELMLNFETSEICDLFQALSAKISAESSDLRSGKGRE